MTALDSFRPAVLTQPTTARLLDLDPDLADALPEEARAAVAAFAVRVDVVDPGPWHPSDRLPTVAPLGVLVVEGLLLRTVALEGRQTAEIVGSGDLIRPWEDTDLVPDAAALEWRALQDVRLAMLDERVAVLGHRFPALVAALIARGVRRSQLLSYQQLIACYPQVERRLIMLFAVLARRWGRVRPGAVVLPIRLTHETIGALVGARRPSVTHHLSLLAEEGLVRRTSEGWLVAMDVVADETAIQPPD